MPQPKHWPSTFSYSPVSVCRDLHPHLFQLYVQANVVQRSDLKEEKKVSPFLEIRKITGDLHYRGLMPHPLADQEVFEGHAQHGVFAIQKIAKGTLLGEYVGEIFVTKQELSHHVIKRRGVYCWHVLIENRWIYIYSGKMANELTFVNDYHGLKETPNARGTLRVHQGFYYFAYEAICDIEPLEEILIDYKSKTLKPSI